MHEMAAECPHYNMIIMGGIIPWASAHSFPIFSHFVVHVLINAA